MMSKKRKMSLKKKILITVLGVIAVIALVAVFVPLSTFKNSRVSGNTGIARRPEAANYDKGKLKKLPSHNKNATNLFEVDVRSADISDLNLKDRAGDLLYSDFDSKTKWPSSLPKEFDPKTIMKYGKDPGLGLSKLHERGITGRNVGVAILDHMILTEHEEYKDRLKLYEEMHADNDGGAHFHGTALCSIAVGKNVGVAPEADLYYIAEFGGNDTLINFLGQTRCGWNWSYMAKAIDRVIEINKTLPKDKKIRVISTSIGWCPDEKGFKEVDDAVKRAKAEGILVVCPVLEQYYGVGLRGIGREPMSDPNNLKNYNIARFWESTLYNNPQIFEKNINKNIMVPTDSRCVASPTGSKDYVFYRTGGLSWATPYTAGLYALCCQVKPEITPDEFFKDVFATGDVNTIEKNGKQYKVGTIVNPQKLIDKLEKEK